MPSGRLSTYLSAQALVVLVCGVLATAVLFVGVSALEYNRTTDEFERRASDRIAAVRDGLEGAVDVLAATNRLFTVVGPVSREQFRAFTQPLLESHPHIRSMTFHRLISAAQRPAFEAGMRRLYPGFALTEISDGKLVPVGVRERYPVVEYIEPLAGNEAVLGLDAFSRREQDGVLRRACETGQASATGIYPLVHGANVALQSMKRGFIIMMPVYRNDAVFTDSESRCGVVIGYTAAVFDADGLVEKLLARQGLLDVEGYDLNVYAGGGLSEGNLMFRTGGVLPVETSLPSLYKWLVHDRPASVARTFEVAGWNWHIVVSPSRAPFVRSHLGSLLTLIGGALSTLLATAYMQSLASRSRRIQRLVDERTTELMQANQALQLRQQAIEACVNPIIITSATGPDYPIEYVNPAFERVTGYSSAEVIGHSCSLLWGNDLEQDGIKEIRAMVREKRAVNAVHRTYRKDGSMFWSDVYVAPVRDASGEAHHFVVANYDVTETKRYEAELEYQASHDALTGLANRNLLRDRLQQAIDYAARYKRSVWLMFIDLDRFKFVNDSLGHRAGDLFLKVISQRLQSVVRQCDTVARFGGDEFMLILPEYNDEQLTPAVVRRIMDAVSEPITIEGHQLFSNCSVGIATYPADAESPDALIEHADLAMYRAKELGRNNFQFYTPAMNERVQERLQIESALRGALERSEFLLHYQPQVDLCGGRVVGMEALLRWQHPEMGLLPPDRFIHLAEETGLIVPLGAWVLRSACAQAKAWQSAGLGNLRMAVNLSAHQFTQPDLVTSIAAIIEETGLPANCLDIELTESMVMTDVDRAIAVLGALRELGVQLSIDDFGTGYSSLSYLKRFPIDVLKIDQSFVSEISRHANDAAISDAIISMAHSLGIRVIAEGVETEAQCEFLSQNMCDEIQGFLFSEALPAAGMEALLTEGRRLPDRLLRLHKRARTLLLVDDEPNILASLKRLLRSAGYQILTASGGQEGLELLAHNEVDVIVSDQRMPGMTGVEFLRQVKKLHPDTVRIVLSGFTELQSVTDAVNEGAIYKFLTKPWDDAKLREHVEEAFQHKEMADENRRLSLEVRTANHGLAKANRQLEEVLQQKQQQITRDEITLDIVREALQHVPLPIIGLDEDEVVAFANIAAQALFKDNGFLLGIEAEQIMPQVLQALRSVGEGEKCTADLNGVRFEVVARSMGKGTQSRGQLITLTLGECA